MWKRLKIVLPEGWSDHSHENPEGPPTFIRDRSQVPGAVQVSSAQYKGGAVPNPIPDDLIALSRGIGERQEAARLLETHSGECTFGIWGTAVFRTSECQRFQIWHLSNGRDLIFITHICCDEPDPDELAEAQDIVNRLNLADRPWWRIW